MSEKRHGPRIFFLAARYSEKRNSPTTMKYQGHYDELWDSFKNGSLCAFSKIYQTYAPLLLSYGYKISADKSLIEDSIHDLFVDLWDSRKRVSRTSSVRFYLFKALRYKIVRNKKSIRLDKMDSLDSHMSFLKESSHEDFYIEHEMNTYQLEHLRDTMANLPARQREAINLRYFHNFSNAEIAEIMHITYPSACKFIYAGLKKLVEDLKVSVMDILLFLCLFKGPFDGG